MTAILVAVPASGVSELLYFCSMTGKVGRKCCCQHETQEETAQGSSLFAPPCCKLVSTNQQLQPPRVEVISPELETSQIVTLPYESGDRFVVAVPMRLALPHDSRGPPDTPLFIKHCSYLI